MNTPNKTLIDLNDDCLMEILQYLTIQETFHLMSLHSRFQDVTYERIAQLKHFEVNFRELPEFTTWQLEIIGQNLKSLYISAGYSLPTDLILQYLKPICSQATHLNTLKLHYFQFDEECQKCLLALAPQIQDLNLNYCQLTDELLEPILKNCQKLQFLSLLGNYTLKCDSLKSLNSKYLKQVQVEQNAFSRDAIQSYVADNPQVSVKVYSQGRLNFNVYGPSE
ncbi:uncharacterized protein LOC111689166 [Lucilia cuprina]|uniref:uncharacterized protein LOC111689166 n=1 Tax=Lucilia cuprina TaxID=7375 RepID=UPI001F0555CA|nr:uncharacterized protein LOC111689166 [Lucilia cuprina]